MGAKIPEKEIADLGRQTKSVKKTEKTQAKESHQAVSTTAPSTISEETVKKYTINRTVKQFDETYKDEENFTDTFITSMSRFLIDC